MRPASVVRCDRSSTDGTAEPHRCVTRVSGVVPAGICVDVEKRERHDGQHANRQVRAIGLAELSPDGNGLWTGTESALPR
jgi:hypothetical protein